MWEKLAATDDEIAQVMGHEIGHALASHTREKMSVGVAAGVGATVLAVLASSRNQNDPNAFQRNQNTFALAAALAITLPNSREAESEADQIGIELAARAGFDPRAAVTLWKKMAAEGGGSFEFFSTHPSPENRMQHLEALVAKVDPLYQGAKDRKPTDIPLFIGYTSMNEASGRPSRDEYVARVAAEPQALTFISDEFEKFKKGEVVFTCTAECALGYSFQKGKWKEMHEKQAWRDLAMAVIRNGYLNDLTYFLLGEAAKGLNLPDVAKAYYSRALEAQKAGKTCGGAFNTCEGFDIPQLVAGASAK
jgi:hypothetical protein